MSVQSEQKNQPRNRHQKTGVKKTSKTDKTACSGISLPRLGVYLPTWRKCSFSPFFLRGKRKGMQAPLPAGAKGFPASEVRGQVGVPLRIWRTGGLEFGQIRCSIRPFTTDWSNGQKGMKTSHPVCSGIPGRGLEIPPHPHNCSRGKNCGSFWREIVSPTFSRKATAGPPAGILGLSCLEQGTYKAVCW